jgi:hypothetical protein
MTLTSPAAPEAVDGWVGCGVLREQRRFHFQHTARLEKGADVPQQDGTPADGGRRRCGLPDGYSLTREI